MKDLSSSTTREVKAERSFTAAQDDAEATNPTAHAWANKLGIPSYDAGLVGYPQRMRDWNARKAAERKRLLSDDDA